MAVAKKKKTPRKKLSPQERSQRALQRAFAKRVRSIFLKAGFVRVPEASDVEFSYEAITSDFDDIFVRENIIVLCEHTLTKESNLGSHVKTKAHVYNAIFKDPLAFLAFLKTKFPEVCAKIPTSYHDSQVVMRIVYCSEPEVKSEHQSLAKGAHFLWAGSIRYFKELTDTIKLSARFELAQFLEIPFLEIGDNGSLPTSVDSSQFAGTVLPEPHSNFPPGYKVLSFYVSPGALLSRAYVLRKGGWKDDAGLYQRMIDKRKVESIRKYLRREHRTFVNNVIVTLPDSTKILDENEDTVNPTSINKTTPVMVRLPAEANSVGIVDGQHRIFSYYEDSQDDPTISSYRQRQNLLATGIMYPQSLPEADRNKFEAALFLEINSTQNAAKSDLKQAIAVITDPFSPDSVGKRVIGRLGLNGPLEGLIERHVFDTGVLKTTSIVSYALRPLVRIDGEDSLFKLWTSAQKSKVETSASVDDLLQYVAFSATEINTFLGAAKAVLGSTNWRIRDKDGGGWLSVTTLNALLILFRKMVKRQGLKDFETYKIQLNTLATVDVTPYRSSQYNRMADDVLKKIFPPVAISS